MNWKGSITACRRQSARDKSAEYNSAIRALVRTRRERWWAIPSLPAFKAKVTNNNEHIIRLQGAVLKLADNSGNLYDVISKEELKQRNAKAINENASKPQSTSSNGILTVSQPPPQPQDTAQMIQDVTAKIDSLNILDATAEILPGFSGTYYMVFKYPDESQTSTDVNADWVASHQPLKVMLFDVVTETDQAGNVSRKTKFEFPVEAKIIVDTYQNGQLVSSTPQ